MRGHESGDVVGLLDAGADLAFVKDWLGHANIQNTTIYARAHYGNTRCTGTHDLCESSGGVKGRARLFGAHL